MPSASSLIVHGVPTTLITYSTGLTDVLDFNATWQMYWTSV